jgi:hypothetical protein
MLLFRCYEENSHLEFMQCAKRTNNASLSATEFCWCPNFICIGICEHEDGINIQIMSLHGIKVWSYFLLLENHEA